MGTRALPELLLFLRPYAGQIIETPLLPKTSRVLDLSTAAGHKNISAYLHGQTADKICIGRYNEDRPVYTSPLFTKDARSLHLGIDLFVPVGTGIHAPLDGVVHSVKDNKGNGDYGPTVILEHQHEDVRFFTLYGHLSQEVLQLQQGQEIRKGARFATVGSTEINGGWEPHVHFQIISDMLGKEGDFPGVCNPTDAAYWLSLCPDPNLLLQIPHAATQGLQKLFVYGTLLDEQVQRQVLRRTLPGMFDMLMDAHLSLITLSGHVYPCVVSGTGMVGGKLVEVSDAEVEILDAFETEAYVRIKVQLRSGISADTYFATLPLS